MQIWAEPEKSALAICNYSQILYQFLTFTQNLKRSLTMVTAYFLLSAGFIIDNYHDYVLLWKIPHTIVGYNFKKICCSLYALSNSSHVEIRSE